jgi:hypothetical protein
LEGVQVINTRIFDIELFPNYLLASFYNPDSKKFDDFEYFGENIRQDVASLAGYIKTLDTLIGFNNLSYDNAVLKYFLKTRSIKAAKELSDAIIKAKWRKPEYLTANDYDVLGILDRDAKLKLFEARIGLTKVLESPIPFENALTENEATEIKSYCHNDILATWELWQHRTTQEKFRVKSKVSEVYEQNLTSSSESEIASMVLQAEIKKFLGLNKFVSLKEYSKTCFDFLGSDVINPDILFETPALQSALQAAKAFHFTQESFKRKKGFIHKLNISGIQVNIGQGGLHSIGKRAIILDLKPGEAIIDCDVSSYYPNIIVEEQIAPDGLENAFLTVYNKILASRMVAKKAGDKAKSNVFKIVLNSLYGKFGSKASWLYNPQNMMKVTLNCQFRLLQLIEKITLAKIEILRINTDGVLCVCKNEAEQASLNTIVDGWEKLTALEMEKNSYRKLVMKDSNNYLAIKEDGSTKENGGFITQPYLLGGGAHCLIVAKAVKAFFLEGIAPEQTVRDGKNILDFCFYARRECWLGEGINGLQSIVNRWLWAKGAKNKLLSVTETGKKTEDINIKLANDIGSIAVDELDIERYIEEAKDTIEAIKTGQTPKQVQKKRRRKSPQEIFNFEDGEEIETESEFEELPVPEEPTTLAAIPKIFTIKTAIEFYKACGFPIIAELPGTKKACWNGWPKIPKEKTWEKIAKEHNRNIAIRDDHLAVIDIDSPTKAKELLPDLRFPDTAITLRGDRTPDQIRNLLAKGHLYFKRPDWLTESIKVIESSGDMIIEIRTGNKCLNTAPPSQHPDGTLYQWHNLELLPNLPELPKEVYDKIKAVYDGLNPPRPEKPRKSTSKQTQEIEYLKGQITIFDILAMFQVEIITDGNAQYIYCLWHTDKGRPNCQINLQDSDLPSCHCYSCGANKDVIDTYMVLAKCDFSKAISDLKALAQEKHKQSETIEAAPTIQTEELQTLYTTCTLTEFKDQIEKIREKSLVLFQGGTGIGKTFTMLLAMVYYALRGIPTVLFCSTVAEARRVIEKLKGIAQKEGLAQTALSFITSRSVATEEEEQDQIAEPLALRKIIVTTYGYLGRKGDTASGYKLAHQMIEGRIVFCDEVQELWGKILVAYPLLARYVLSLAHKMGGGTYSRAVKCPKTARKGECSKCTLAALRKSIDKQTHERKFYFDFSERTLATHIERDDLGVSSWDTLLNPQKYLHVNNTLFYQPLFFNCTYDLLADMNAQTYIEFLTHLAKHLYNAHIRNEYPIDKKEATPILPETILTMNELEQDTVKFPVMACGIPTLCGVDLLGLLQFFGGSVQSTTPKGTKEEKFKGAKSIIMSSATIPESFATLMAEIAEKKIWTLEHKELDEIPFKFDVTLLKTQRLLSNDRIAKLIIALDKIRQEKAFVVTSRKSESDSLVIDLRAVIPDKVVYFIRRDFETERATKGLKTIIEKYYVTYSRSAISRGEDFPEVNFLILDCQQFLPFAAIAEIHPLMSDKDKNDALIADIRQNITQVLGRLLRSLLARVPGQTIKDTRKIVVVIHGLPEGLLDFQVNPKLVFATQEVKETWLYPESQQRQKSDKITNSIIESICLALDGKSPRNFEEIAKQEAMEKVKSEGIENLSKKQREVTKEERATLKAERTAERTAESERNIEEQAKEMITKGMEKREIVRKLNLHRFPEILRKIFGDCDK